MSASDVLQEVLECFHAAEAEGLSTALAETTDTRLKDLVERRLMHALYAVEAEREVHNHRKSDAQALAECLRPLLAAPVTGPLKAYIALVRAFVNDPTPEHWAAVEGWRPTDGS